MPAHRSLLAGLLAACAFCAACASDTPASDPELAPLTERDIRVRAERRAAEGRERGFPDLSEVPARREAVPSAAELTAERGALEEEAEALKVLRGAAARRPRTSGLERQAAALRDAVARDRAVRAAQGPIAVPPAAPTATD